MDKVSSLCVSLDLEFPQCVLLCQSISQFVTNALQSHKCVLKHPPLFPYPRGTTKNIFISKHIATDMSHSIDMICPKYEYSYDSQDPFHLRRLSHNECIHMVSPLNESLYAG